MDQDRAARRYPAGVVEGTRWPPRQAVTNRFNWSEFARLHWAQS